MKGLVFNLLEDFIVEGWGEEAYEQIFAECPLKTKGPFVGPGTYPDSDLVAIAQVGAAKLGVSLDDALVAFGKFSFPRLAAKVPKLMRHQRDAKRFLMSIDSVIHVEVRKLFPEAITPRFTCVDTGEDELQIRYESKRGLCRFMEGLLQGVAEHFETDIAFEQTACMHRGAAHCQFALRFSSPGEQAA